MLITECPKCHSELTNGLCQYCGLYIGDMSRFHSGPPSEFEGPAIGAFIGSDDAAELSISGDIKMRDFSYDAPWVPMEQVTEAINVTACVPHIEPMMFLMALIFTSVGIGVSFLSPFGLIFAAAGIFLLQQAGLLKTIMSGIVKAKGEKYRCKVVGVRPNKGIAVNGQHPYAYDILVDDRCGAYIVKYDTLQFKQKFSVGSICTLYLWHSMAYVMTANVIRY